MVLSWGQDTLERNDPMNKAELSGGNASQVQMKHVENQIIVYQPNETVWLTQEQIANLFGTKRPAITKHLANIYKSGELEREGTCSILEHMGNDGKQSYRTMFYNLDAILSVGYRVNSRNATLFRRWATQVLKTYLLRGYAVNTRLSQLEDRVDRRLAKHDERIATLEEKVDFFVQTKEPPLQSIFYQNKFWDAKSLLIKFIRRTRKELIVIDAYPGVATLDMLAKRGRGVKIELVTHSNGDLEESDYEAFGAQCGKFTKTICGICHDRFIIVDQKEIFWTGASLKDAGRLTFAAAKMGAEIIPGLLESIRKATLDCKEYGGNGKPAKSSRKKG